MNTQLQNLSRTVVRSTLGGMRLPLSTAQRLAGKSADKAWAPTMLFEGFQSTALQFAGGLLRDEELVQEGRLQAAKLSELKRAAELEAEAERTRMQADATLEQERAAAAKAKEQAEQQAREREVAVERETQRAKTELAKQAREAEAQVEQAEARREEAVATKKRQAKLKAVDAETKALAKQAAAIAAAENVEAINDRFEAKKRQRKTG